MVTWIVLFLVAALAMEPISAGIHRFIGHGVGWPIHRSHHDSPVTGLEANDLIPAVSALATIGLFALGATVESLRLLLPVAGGVTFYGLAYAVAHDLYIHRRLLRRPMVVSWLEPVRVAHLRHHHNGTDDWGLFWPALIDVVWKSRRRDDRGIR